MNSYDVQLQCILANGLHHVYCNVIAGILCRRDVAGEKGAAAELKLNARYTYMRMQSFSHTMYVLIQPCLSSPYVLAGHRCASICLGPTPQARYCVVRLVEGSRGGEVISMLHKPTGTWCRVIRTNVRVAQIIAAVNIVCSKALNPTNWVWQLTIHECRCSMQRWEYHALVKSASRARLSRGGLLVVFDI